MAASFLVSCSSFFTYSQAESDGQHLKLWKVHPWTIWEGTRGKHIITIIRESSAAIDWTLAWSVRLSSSCCMEIFSSSRFWSCTNAAWRITLHEKPMYQPLDLSRWSCCRNFRTLFCYPAPIFIRQDLQNLEELHSTSSRYSRAVMAWQFASSVRPSNSFCMYVFSISRFRTC
jgi:hypothetical protein